MAKNLATKLKKILNEEFSSYLSKLAIVSEEKILKNFDNEKDADGEAFAKLEKYTQNEKRRLGYGGKKILQREGDLKKSIKDIPNMSKKTLTIDSEKYGEYLHDGIRSKKSGIKKWKILDLPKELRPGGSKREDIFEKFSTKFENRIIAILQNIE